MGDGMRQRRGANREDPPEDPPEDTFDDTPDDTSDDTSDDIELEQKTHRTGRASPWRTPRLLGTAVMFMLGFALSAWLMGYSPRGRNRSPMVIAQQEIQGTALPRPVDESGRLRRTNAEMARNSPQETPAAVEYTFPPGCRWDCYLCRNKDIAEFLFNREWAALNHYANIGSGEGRECGCEGECSGEFPPGCRWDCYLGRNKDLARKLNHTEEAALGHWRGSGRKAGRKCSCEDGEKSSGKEPKGDQPQNQSKGKAIDEGDKGDEKVISFPPGCSWECYLSRYEDLSRKLKHTEKAALKHYVEVGARKGRKCSCLSADAVTDAKVEPIVPGENAKGMPTFHSVPLPDSKCHSVDKGTFKYCKKVDCMQHEKDVDEKLLQSALGGRAEREGGADAPGGCKMLWFSALHENDDMICKKGRKAYSVFYSVALESALLNAPDALQPVLVLGRYGMPNENSTEHKKFGAWAERRGVKVIYSPRLSFQEYVDRARPSEVKSKQFSDRQGPFLRLDIPHYISEHNLLDIPGVCKKYVLWTDADVIFANKINQQDIHVLSELTGDSLMMFGREHKKKAHLKNAGVIVMNIEKFTEELPKFHAFSRAHPDNYFNVQRGLINSYMDAGNKDKFQLLPLHYNWPPYWQVEPSSFSQIKIIHTHGPKPGRYIEEIAVCDRDAYDSNRALQYLKEKYLHLFKQGVCCDQGRTAKWTLDAFRQLRAPIDELC